MPNRTHATHRPGAFEADILRAAGRPVRATRRRLQQIAADRTLADLTRLLAADGWTARRTRDGTEFVRGSLRIANAEEIDTSPTDRHVAFMTSDGKALDAVMATGPCHTEGSAAFERIMKAFWTMP